MDNLYIAKVLRLNDLFKSMELDILVDLLSRFNFKINTYHRGSIIHLESIICESFDVIISGEAIIQNINIDGQIVTLTTFKQGSTIGGNKLFCSNNEYPMTISALKETTIVHFNKDLIIYMCQNYEAFLIDFLRDLADKSDLLSERFRALSIGSIRKQITVFIKREYLKQNSDTIVLGFTKKEWAEKLGIQRTSLSRELQKMKIDGLISYDQKKIKLENLNFFQ